MTISDGGGGGGDAAILVNGLEKRYGQRPAVLHGIDLHVAPGTFFGFLGANGAGKSTLIRILTGFAAPTAGTARVAGCNPVSERRRLMARIGIVSEDVGVYETLSAREFLDWAGRMRGLSPAESSRRSDELLALLQLLPADAGRHIAEYSLGMRKKTALAAALLHAPGVLFLDEPFNGLDAASVRALSALLRELTASRGVTVFFTSHVFETIERLCDRAAVLSDGRIVAEGTLGEIKAQASGHRNGSLEEAFALLVGADDPPALDETSLPWYVPAR